MSWKQIGKKLLFPPLWVMAVLVLLSAALLTLVFVKGWEQSVTAYVVYVLAFYTLSVVCIFCCTVLPKQHSRIKQRIYDHPLASRYLTDRAFRTQISLYISLTVSMLYVLINLLFWYLNRSWWFAVLAAYYVILAVMRFLLVRYVRKNRIGTSVLKEWKRARLCAYILLLVNLSLSGAVLMILFQNKGYDYPGIMVYVMAMYSFYSTIHAIVDVIKYRNLDSPIMSTAKMVSLSAALVSMLNLETAMFAQFGGDMSLEDQRLMIILTGAGVSVTVVALAAILIVNATKEIRREKHGKQ